MSLNRDAHIGNTYVLSVAARSALVPCFDQISMTGTQCPAAVRLKHHGRELVRIPTTNNFQQIPGRIQEDDCPSESREYLRRVAQNDRKRLLDRATRVQKVTHLRQKTAGLRLPGQLHN